MHPRLCAFFVRKDEVAFIMSREERLQEILKAFVDTLNNFAEGRHSPEVHAATIQRLLAEVRELKGMGDSLGTARATARLSA